MKKSIGFAVLMAAMATRCATPRVSLRESPRAYTANQYDDVLARWTRTGHVYTLNPPDDQLVVSATFESWDFRWAYVVRYAADFRIATEDRSRLLEASLAASRTEHEFYVALATQNRRWGELTRPTSAWRAQLVNDRRMEVSPLAIEPVNRPGALERTYFPYTTPFRQVFRVRFPRRVRGASGEEELLTPTTKYFILRFSGPLGSLDLRWDVER